MIADSRRIQSEQKSKTKDIHRVKELLKPGVIYEAYVEAVNIPSNSCQVRLKHEKIAVDNCVWAAGVISGMLGFKTSYVPPAKTAVLVVNCGFQPYYIIGCVPQSTTDTQAPARPALDAGSNYRSSVKFSPQSQASSPSFGMHKPPIDLVEGEFQMDNMLGVGLSLLRNLSRLQAGELAKVECHLLDDMVRIVSDTFKHYTAFGDYEIKNDDGKLNVQWHGTAYDYESWGMQNPTQPKATFSGENRIKQAADGYLDNGRWRFSQYMGFLGDFIKMWVTDPQEQVGKIAEGQFRSGKARLNIGNDGGILVQSVSEIVFEKVVRIPVPIQINLPGAAVGGNTLGASLPPAPLVDWKPSDTSNLFETVFQLREYSRWLANQYALGRFQQLPGRYQIPSEAQTPVPDRYSDEADRKAANTHTPVNYRLAYATHRIMRDGSIIYIDAYGNSQVSTAAGITISTVADLRLEAAGNVFISAGKTINIVGRMGINIASILDSVRVKCAKILDMAAGTLASLVAKGQLQISSQQGQLIIDSKATLLTGDAVVAGDFTAGDTFGVSGGVASCLGTLSAIRVMAQDTLLEGEGPHPGHMYEGYEDALIDSSLKLQATPAAEAPTTPSGAYESPTTQYIRSEGLAGQFELWDLSSLSAAGSAVPWNATNKVFDSKAQMNTPSDQTTFQPSPSAPMTSQPTQVYVQKS